MEIPTDPRALTSERPITGRFVLVCLVAFFAVIFLANGMLVRAALGTFGGVETESAYKAGLAFKADEAEARAQAALCWKVEFHLERESLAVSAVDAQGRPLSGVTLVANLRHPLDRRLDESIETVSISPGRWKGNPDAAPGQWDLVVELWRGDLRAFRSINRVVVR